MSAATSPTLFASAGPTPTPTDVADDHSLLKLDYELDLLLEQIEDEIEESGEASQDAMDRLQLFCQAMNVKVDRIGRYLAVMKTRVDHCKQETARYAARAKRAETKIAHTESMVLYCLEIWMSASPRLERDQEETGRSRIADCFAMISK